MIFDGTICPSTKAISSYAQKSLSTDQSLMYWRKQHLDSNVYEFTYTYVFIVYVICLNGIPASPSTNFIHRIPLMLTSSRVWNVPPLISPQL